MEGQSNMYNVFVLGTMLLILIIPDYSLGMCRADKQPLRVKFSKSADKTNGPKTYWVSIGLPATLNSGKQNKAKSSTVKAGNSNKTNSVPIASGNIGQNIVQVMLGQATENSGRLAKKLEAFRLNDQGSLANIAREQKETLNLIEAVCAGLRATQAPSPTQQTSSPQASNISTTPPVISTSTSTASPVTYSWCALF